MRQIESANGIVVTRGKDGKPLALTVPSDVFVTGINRIKELKAGMYVQLHVEIENGKLIAKQLRVR